MLFSLQKNTPTFSLFSPSQAKPQPCMSYQHPVFQRLEYCVPFLHKDFCSGLSYVYRLDHQNDTSVIHRDTALGKGLPVRDG